MPSPTPEQLFARFRDANDIAALAAVFDALAGQLLLVAGHLVRDGALAEDLVQTTFVEAMRSAGRYDARRPLLPWLVRILTHHARKDQRRRRRHDLARATSPANAPSALANVLDREAMAAIQAGLVTLPVTYQQVLTLRLVHDLTPTAIAHALGCSPETVKTRLRRGMELLRHHLPTGLASTLLLLLFADRGLAAVRSDVLNLATGRVNQATSAMARIVILGGVLMKQWLLWTTSAVVVIALGCALALQGPGSDAPVPTHEDRPTVAHADSPPATGSDVAPQRASAPPPAIVFRGRCVDAATRQPLARVRTVLHRVSSERHPADYELVARQPEGQSDSDADGRFELACERVPDLAYDLSVGNPEHIACWRTFGPFSTARTIELGEVALQAGVRVTSRVVDRSGKPVADIQVNVTQGKVLGRNDSLMQRSWWTMRSDRDGRIVWPSAVPPGQYWLTWDLELVDSERLHDWLVIPPVTAHENVLVWPVEDAGQSIAGRVLDARGQPLARVPLQADGAGTRGYAMTREDGSFLLPRIGPFDATQTGPVRLQLGVAAEDLELLDAPTFRWGDRDVQLRAGPTCELVVRALDPRTGTPLQSFEIACATLAEDGSPATVVFGRSRPRQHRADGSLCMAVAARPHVVQVFPTDPALAPSAKLVWDPRNGNVLTVPLEATHACPVRVVDADGAPVVDTEVWSLRPIEAIAGPARSSDWQEVTMPAVDDLQQSATQRWARMGIDDAPLGSARTGADGRARLPVPSDVDVVIAAAGPGHVPLAMVGRASPNTEILLRVERGAGLRVTVTPKDVVAQLLRPRLPSDLAVDAIRDSGSGEVMLWVQRVAGEQDRRHWQREVRCALSPQGSYECRGLPPGSYDLILTGNIPSGPGDGILVHWPFQTLRLREGEIREVTVDVSRLRKGRLQGQVLVNGRPWCWGNGSLLARFPEGSASCEISTDAEGRFDVEVSAGDYRLHLYHRPKRHQGVYNMGYWYADETHHVVAGGTTPAVFTSRCIAATVRITRSDGTPAIGVTATVQCSTEPQGWMSWTTDTDGRFVIEPAPRVPFSLVFASTQAVGPDAERSSGAARDAVFGPFQVPATGDHAEFHAELPADWR